MNELTIGKVIHVTGGRVDVLVTAEKMDVTYEGRTHRIGQLGTYLTIPVGDHTIVGFVTGSGRLDQTNAECDGNIVVNVQLVGEIAGGRFARGVNAYPIVGDLVWLAVRRDFETIFGSLDELPSDDEHRTSFSMGRFALSTDFEVQVLGSEFFAKHAAIV
ncbi:MAG: hypothetical protein JSV78_13655, partial [Phycisphaerales bacterium]